MFLINLGTDMKLKSAETAATIVGEKIETARQVSSLVVNFIGMHAKAAVIIAENWITANPDTVWKMRIEEDKQRSVKQQAENAPLYAIIEEQRTMHEEAVLSLLEQHYEQDAFNHDYSVQVVGYFAGEQRQWQPEERGEEYFNYLQATFDWFEPRVVKSVLLGVQTEQLTEDEAVDYKQVLDWVSNDQYAVHFSE